MQIRFYTNKPFVFLEIHKPAAVFMIKGCCFSASMCVCVCSNSLIHTYTSPISPVYPSHTVFFTPTLRLAWRAHENWSLWWFRLEATEGSVIPAGQPTWLSHQAQEVRTKNWMSHLTLPPFHTQSLTFSLFFFLWAVALQLFCFVKPVLFQDFTMGGIFIC